MVKVLIIADDVTGMLDTGAQFAQRGIRTEALIRKPTVEELRQSEAVVAVFNTGTRHASKEQAYKMVYEISRIAVEAGVGILFKKTDSALRGNTGAELTALMDAADEEIDFFPAYPDAGRTTAGGIQYADSIPISESVFGRDELNPVTDSYIPRILGQTSQVSVKLAQNIDEWEPGNKEKRITVFDAGSTGEFHQIVEQYLKKKSPRLLAGCAGLAHELADQLLLPAGGQPQFLQTGRIFALCGSSNPITRQQMDYAQEHGYERFTLKQSDMSGKEQLPKIRRACLEGKSVIVDMKYLSPEIAEQMGITKEQLGSLIVDSVNRILIQCMDVLKEHILFLTGGDTLGGFIRLSGCERIRVLGEYSPGIAMNIFYIRGKEVYTISKSGGFGNKEILIQLSERKEEKIYERKN